MKKTIILFIFIAISMRVSAQTKNTFVLKSFPTYDEFGNYYEVIKSFNHIPTYQDSVNFKRESRIQIRKQIDSIRKIYYIPTKKLKKN